MSTVDSIFNIVVFYICLSLFESTLNIYIYTYLRIYEKLFNFEQYKEHLHTSRVREYMLSNIKF